MSYSRWGSICTLISFTAKQLRDDVDKCIKKVQKLDEFADDEKTYRITHVYE